MPASSLWAEAEASIGELRLVDDGQYLVDGLLHHAVYHCRYAQQAHFAVVLGYLYPTDWIGTVTTVQQGAYQFILIGQEPREQLLT